MEYEKAQGSTDYRIKRIYRGAWADPDWQVVYHWGAGAYSDKLVKITDARGLDSSFIWDSNVSHVVRIDVGWSGSGVVTSLWFRYSGALLDRIVYPKRTMTYDWTHDGDYQDANEVLSAYPALEFSYGASAGRITRFQLAAYQNPSDTSPISGCREDRLKITYQASPDPVWRVEKVERPGKDPSTWLADEFSYQTNPDRVTWKDPLDVVRTYQWEAWPGGQSLLERSIVKVTHQAPSTDPRVQDGYYAHPTLTWTFTWDHLRILTMDGPSESGGKSLFQPLHVEWTYDGQGRGLLTSVTARAEGDGSGPTLSRSWEWSDWGSPWEDPDEPWRIRGVSRLIRSVDAAGRSVDLSYEVFQDRVVTTLSFPEAGDGRIEEDPLGRVTYMEEPPFQAESGGQSGTSGNPVSFEYGDDAPGTAGYRLVSQMVRYRGLNGTDPVKTHVSYTGLGQVLEVTVLPDHQSLTRKIRLVYDGAGQVEKVWLPDPNSGNVNSAGLPDLRMERDPFGKVVRLERHAQYLDGTQVKNYPNEWLVDTLFFDYGGRIHQAVLERAPMDTASDPNDPDHWLIYEWSWDKGGRIEKFRGPLQGNDACRETDLVWDTFGFPYKVRRLLRGSPASSSGTSVPVEWAEGKYGFRALGALAESVDATGFVKTYDSDGFGRITGVHWKGTDGSGDKSLSVNLDGEGLVLEAFYLKGPAGSETTLKKWMFTRDGLGRVKRKEIWDGGPTLKDWADWTYTGLFYPLTYRDKNGRGRDWTWDPMGLLAKVEDTLSSTRKNALRVTRNAAGEVTLLEEIFQKETDWGQFASTPTIYKTGFTYDRRSRMTSRERIGVASSTLSKRVYTFDLLDRIVKIQDYAKDGSGTMAARKWMEFSYDALGRERTRKIFPTGGTSGSEVTLTTRYVDLPQLSGGGLDPELGFILEKIDSENHVTSYRFDRGGRLFQRRVPGYQEGSSHHQWTYSHDKEGRLTSWTDGNGTQVTIDYDSLMRPIRRYGTPGSWTLSAMTTREEFSYDDFNRITKAQTLFNSWTAPANLVAAGAEFDLLGRIQKETYQWRGMAASEAKVLVSGWAFSGGDDTGFRRRLGYSSGWNFQFTPDGAGKTTGMKIASPGSQTYTELGRWRYEGSLVLGRRIYRDGSHFLEESLTRNALGMLTAIDVDGGSTLHEEIVRDWLGNVLAVKYPRPETVGQESAVGDAFDLDGFDRLIGAKLGIKGSDWGKPYSQITQWGDRKLSYALDKVHNRDQVDTWDSGNQQSTTTYSQETGSNRYAGVDQAALTYDQNGNLVWDGVLGQMYVFDYLDRLCEVWRPYSTGALLKAKGGFTQKEIRDLSAALHKGLDPAKLLSSGTGAVKSSSGWELVAYIGYDPWNRKAFRSVAGDGTYAYTWDGWKRSEEYRDQGDGKTYVPTRVFFDGPGIDEHLGYAYTSDGGTSWTSRTTTQVHNDYGYTCRTHDPAIGLLYYRNRWYHHALGRFLTYDPIGLWGDPGNWGNGYIGFGSKPKDSPDPFGLYTSTIIDLPPKDPQWDSIMRRAKGRAEMDPDGGCIIYRGENGAWIKRDIGFNPDNPVQKGIDRRIEAIEKIKKEEGRLEALKNRGALGKSGLRRLKKIKNAIKRWSEKIKELKDFQNKNRGIVHVEVFGHGFLGDDGKGRYDGSIDAIVFFVQDLAQSGRGFGAWVVIGACFQGSVPKGSGRKENLAASVSDALGFPVKAFTGVCGPSWIFGPIECKFWRYINSRGREVMVEPSKEKVR